MSMIAPDYVTPSRRRRHRAPIVSLKPVGAPVSEGIRLWVNADKYGYQLGEGVEGFGLANVENTLTPSPGGGAVLRHQRSTEGDMFLPIQLVAPSSAALDDMTARLAAILSPANSEFEVVYYSPVSQEARFRRAAYKSGMDTPAFDDPLGNFAEYGITADYQETFWRGEEREIPFEIGPARKPLITAYKGEPDPDAPPAVTYEWEDEPHASPSVKRVGGEETARNLHPNPVGLHDRPANYGGGTTGEVTHEHITNADDGPLDDITTYWRATTITQAPTGSGGWSGTASAYRWDVSVHEGDYVVLSYFIRYTGSADKTTYTPRIYLYDQDGNSELFNMAVSQRPDFTSGEWVRVIQTVQAPFAAEQMSFWLYFTSGSDTPAGSTTDITGLMAATADTEEDALAQVEEYFDGDTEDVQTRHKGYEFPFIPMMVHSSTVQGEQAVRVEGDAPVYPTYTVTGPGKDLRIFNQAGDMLHVPGEVTSPVTIVTEQGKQSVRNEEGSLMHLLEFGSDSFFQLPVGDSTIGVTMVDATPESRVVVSYEERFRLPKGGGIR